MAKHRRNQIEWSAESEKGTNTVDLEGEMLAWVKAQRALDKAKHAMEALAALVDRVNKGWKNIDNRVLGVLRSPAISLGVGEHRFTEDWGIFHVDRAKLGDGFQGNKLDLGAF